MKAWHFANTTVRSPFRLREGLIAIKSCHLEGNIRGSEGDLSLRNCLGSVGLVKLGEDSTYSVGRKWRSAMEKLGFLIPNVKDPEIQSVIGSADHISKNGFRLIESDNLQTWQECFLRALIAYRIEENDDFNPFVFVISLMLSLDEKTGSSKLSKDEMGLFTQFSHQDSNPKKMVDEILDYRKELTSLTGRDRKQFIDKQYKKLGGNKQTLASDYPDVNFRYLKATGLFKSSRTSIVLDEDKKHLAKAISEQSWKPSSRQDYYLGRCNGAPLPTDHIDVAKSTLLAYATQLNKLDIAVSQDELMILTEVAEINAKRHDLESQLFQIREQAFAREQSQSVDEILAYIDLLTSKSTSNILSDGTEIEIPSSERPAYFEWIIWRSFLAINSIVNPPWKSRNFKIDPDFKPISHAIGGSSDLIFEFEDFVLVVEVTLTASSRQEAAEGEPVRRHVANYVQHYKPSNKPVYGLFLAVVIDTNTANTFRLGEWYLPDDTQIHVQIVPVALNDFKVLLESKKEKPHELLDLLKTLLIQCREETKQSAPEWKAFIAESFRQTAQKSTSLLGR